MKYRLWVFLAMSALLLSAPAQTWTEQGDAGDLPETAQSTGTGSISRIVGTHGPDDVDMYAIYIANPSAFSATTVGGASFDTQLWLFDANGKGVVFNDDWSGSNRSRIDNTSSCIPGPGLYYLAISAYNRDALGCDGGLIWTDAPYTTIRCPNGPEATSRVARWSGSTLAGGSYTIFLTGAEGASAGNPDDCPPPEPWDEAYNGGGDAGDLPATAQIVHLPDAVHCQTPVQRIRGDLGADDVDMYVICITDPDNFVASTVGGAAFDTQLWLFRCDGTGVVHNDDAVNTTVLQSRIDNSTGCIPAPGIYLLAISRYNRDPVDANGRRLWNDTLERSLNCADGPGRNNPVAGWTGTTPAGRYAITLQGAYFVRPTGCQEPPCQPHNGDVINNGCIDDADLLQVLFAFGQTGSNLGRVDVNCDAVVDDADLLQVLLNFGSGCE
ncbi:MAG: DVUA0089 family protein [Armatimonadota bacterium]